MSWLQIALGLYGALTSKSGGQGGSGAFPIKNLGNDYAKFLSDRLMQNPAETDTFRLGTEAIRDATGSVANAQPYC